MNRMVIRIAIATALALTLTSVGVNGNSAVLQTLFTVLGIVFSISMSLLVSFNLSKVLNKRLRKSLRNSISHTRNMLLYDFGLSTLISSVALIWDSQHTRYDLNGIIILDVMLLGVTLVATSLIYEIYNFRKLHRLHTDIEDAVIAEELDRAEREL